MENKYDTWSCDNWYTWYNTQTTTKKDIGIEACNVNLQKSGILYFWNFMRLVTKSYNIPANKISKQQLSNDADGGSCDVSAAVLSLLSSYKNYHVLI